MADRRFERGVSEGAINLIANEFYIKQRRQTSFFTLASSGI
jgi:hypothetical protein